ncbi:MAG: recombinase RecA [Armatimonadetes bacterium]|nr:recombinase RecA [Armatimonadota bacterium]
MSEKAKALESALAQIERQFGKGALMRLGDAAQMQIESIPTGSLALDIALGVGGIPKGRVIEIFGAESSGKTTLALHIVAEAQKSGGNAVFIDAEHALDPEYAKALGVDIDRLYVAQPSTGEEALEIMDALIRSGAFDAVALDSVAALMPKQEMEGDIGDVAVGAQARLMSQALRKIGGSSAKANTSAIFINQIREKIGVMFGNPETTPGGRALKFWASVRLEVRRVENIKAGTDVIGARARVKVVKNKVAPPFRQAEFDIIFGKGISRSGDLLDCGLNAGVLQKTGAWINFETVRLGQGRENARQYLDDNPEVAAEIERLILSVSSGELSKPPTMAAVDAEAGSPVGAVE